MPPTRAQVLGPRFPAELRPPAPRHFAAFGTASWLIPPSSVSGAERISVGDDVNVLECCSIDVGPAGQLWIGSGSRLLRFVAITCSTEVRIGENVMTSDYVTVSDAFSPVQRLDPHGPPGSPVTIGDGAYLGAHCSIGPGVQVGAGAFVGEGSVVIDDVPAHSVVYGSPARVVRTPPVDVMAPDRPAGATR